jgi:hypothetical protein
MVNNMSKDKYIQPAIPERGYSFVAAGSLYRNFGGYCIYVKYANGPKNKLTIKERTSDYIWIVCPDRELVIVRNNYQTDAFYPYGDSFDECVDLNIFNDSVAKGMGIEYIMTNYAHNANAKNPRIELRTPPEDRIQVLSDSGGLQLARGVKSSIHPRDLVEFYNDNVDAGMILDLPLFFSDIDIAKKAALQQRANIECMLKHSKGVELINIFHGQTLKERRMFRSIVEDERVPRVAIGGIADYGPTAGVNAIYNTIEGGSFKYKQYHVLGIYSAPMVPLMVKLANSSADVHITSDSTSHIQSAVNRAYHFQFDLFHKMARIPIGTRGSLENTTKYLPCQCKVCTTLKYTDIFGFGENRHISELLAIHNAAEMARYAEALQELCISVSPKEYNHIVYKHQLKDHRQKKDIECALDFIDKVDKHGLAAAQKANSNILNAKRLIEIPPKKTLFGEPEVYVDKSKEAIIEQLNTMKRQLKEKS